jgi:hypothetical protein
MRARDVVIFVQSHRNVCLYDYIVAFIFYHHSADAADNAGHVTAIIFDCIASHVRVAGVVFTEHFVYMRTKLRCLY